MLWCMTSWSHINPPGYLNIMQSRSQRSLRRDTKFAIILIALASLYTDDNVSIDSPQSAVWSFVSPNRVWYGRDRKYTTWRSGSGEYPICWGHRFGWLRNQAKLKVADWWGQGPTKELMSPIGGEADVPLQTMGAFPKKEPVSFATIAYHFSHHKGG